MTYATDDWPALPPLSALTNRVHCMDALELLALLPANSIDAIVTDPPYGLAFMGKKWDYDVPGVDTWREALRVLKPGGHALIACGTRTQHRMAVNVEDGGFEIRDIVAWVYGSGFPKSLDISKAIDREAGAAREVVGEGPYTTRRPQKIVNANTYGNSGKNAPGNYNSSLLTAPATDAARQWDGWGTALKPAMELFTMARKPVIGTVAQNVQAWGTGGLNVDACRVGTSSSDYDEMQGRSGGHASYGPQDTNNAYGTGLGSPIGEVWKPNAQGRWPANFIHDGSDEVLALFPVTGAAKASKRDDNRIHLNDDKIIYGERMGGRRMPQNSHDDNGGSAARFFYTAKPAADERHAGVDGGNVHPTVKAISLMRYLCRLITPPGGIVLDMFAGSGTTALAAREEGFRFILCEREAEYVAIARARLAQPYTLPMFDAA